MNFSSITARGPKRLKCTALKLWFTYLPIVGFLN
uniref:Uncharacterized protein n=1 Tax=Rhizophora mucronata TaxID=61149 RepID=A0A2P2N1Y3_RHIMU